MSHLWSAPYWDHAPLPRESCNAGCDCDECFDAVPGDCHCYEGGLS